MVILVYQLVLCIRMSSPSYSIRLSASMNALLYECLPHHKNDKVSTTKKVFASLWDFVSRDFVTRDLVTALFLTQSLRTFVGQESLACSMG